MQKQRQIEMTGDRIFFNMLLFAIPIIISNFCQRLFNAADSVIVGRFCGPNALAAVGGTSPVVSLFSWGLMGFSVGADVVVSRLIGQRDAAGVRRAVHTSYVLAFSVGAVMAVIGALLARPILTAMGVPMEILAWSVLYLRIYFLGLFFNVIYNFGAACLRSGGDSRRPTAYMIAAGVLNVILNLLFVAWLDMGVAGVAIATAISQLLAAFLVTAALLREKGDLRLEPHLLRLDGSIARQIVMIGLPACLQNAMFCIANIVIQSSINAFGSLTMAANSAATTIEEFVYVGSGAVNQTCTTFTGQNNGAGKLRNIRKVLLLSLASTTCLGLLIGITENLLAAQLLGFFTTDAEMIALGTLRLRFVVLPLFLNGVMDVFGGSMRGMGSSFTPMLTSLAGICGFRLLYVFTVFAAVQTLPCLYLCYPLSWLITIAVLVFLWRRCYRRRCAAVQG